MGVIRAMLSAIARRLTSARVEYRCVPSRMIHDPTPRRMDMELLTADERAEAEELFAKLEARAAGGPDLSRTERDRLIDLRSGIRWVPEAGYEDSAFVYYVPAENAALVSAGALAVMLRQGGMRCAVAKADDGETDIVLEDDSTRLLLTVREGLVFEVAVDQTFVDERAKTPRACELLESLGWVRDEGYER